MPAKYRGQKWEFRDGQITDLVDTNGFRPVKARLLPPKPTLVFSTTHPQDNITSFPIGALVGLSLEDDFVSFWATLLDIQSEVCGMVQDLRAAAVWAHFLDDLPSSAAVATCHLSLREHSREYLLLHESDSSPVTCLAAVDVVIRGGAASPTMIAENFLLDHKLGAIHVKFKPEERLNW